MKRPPAIITQLVHIQGPLKGEIQEFSESEIVIGRSPSCHLRFPAGLAIVSRVHAKIVREGNRFKVVDRSVNGTFVNGKRTGEAYLKDGDVITFAEGGPKVSFLTRMGELSAEAPSTPPRLHREEHRYPAGLEPRSTDEYVIPSSPSERSAARPDSMRRIDVAVGKVKAPVVIQYGPTLQSFKEVPVTIGRNPNSDYVLDHPAVLDRHLQIFFHDNQYWVKDLTGQNSVLVNRRPIDRQAPLVAGDVLAISSAGPSFRFLGGGRLAEVQE